MRKTSAIINGTLGGVKVGDNFPVRIMGAINLTKNSFYSGSVKTSEKEILLSAIQMEKGGADFLDLGARSTAPYRTSEIDEETEIRLIKGATKLLFGTVSIPISVDTTRFGVAKVALDEGAQIINDPYGLKHSDGKRIADLASESKCSLIITAHEEKIERVHDPLYRIKKELEKSLRLLDQCGVNNQKIVIDPGIGFFSDAKLSNVEWNCTALAKLSELRSFSHPILVGISRKSFIGSLAGGVSPDMRLPGSLSATGIAVYNGTHIVRTHDVVETAQAVTVASKIRQMRLSR
ncbi:MAG: dihydropteroate synthase [Nitrososphaerales archaeon]